MTGIMDLFVHFQSISYWMIAAARKYFSLFLLFIVVPGIAFANEQNLYFDKQISVSSFAGYRLDDLSWNIAGNLNGSSPNILSELEWESLRVLQVGFQGEFNFSNTIFPSISTYFLFEAGLGKILDGENRDSDYGGDNRTQEVSRILSSTNSGETQDVSAALGPHFAIKEKKFSVVPLMGYAQNKQYLNLTNGFRVIPNLGHITGLDSTYETKWRGPWFGFLLKYYFLGKSYIFTRFDYHWVNYYAKADWNLRSDFNHPLSFEHEADGEGTVYIIGLHYILNQKWAIGIKSSYQSWVTGSGTDRVFFADGTVITTRLNKVSWDSFSLNIQLSYNF